MTRAVALTAALAVMLVIASPVKAAAPNYILVSGPGLKRPVLLANWTENHALLLSLVDAPRAKPRIVRSLGQRPRFDLAEFWDWGSKPRPTQPSEANQHGWFYPARGSQPAVFDVMVDGIRTPRVGPAQALAILARHGVPKRI